MRYPTQYKLYGTKPFRVAAAKWFNGAGGNLTNPPKDALSVFAAPRGRVIVQADQSGADAVVVAYSARAGNYRALFQTGIKPHTFLALHIFANSRPDWFEDLPSKKDDFINAGPADLAKLPGWKELNERITNSDDEYFAGKGTVHGKAYRMGRFTFVESLLVKSGGRVVFSPDDGARFLLTYDSLFPEVIEWQFEIEHAIRTYRLLRNAFGFPREFNEILTDSYIRDGLSWVPASTVACITHTAFVRVQRRIDNERLDWDLVSNKHDSLACEVPESDAFECAKELKSSLAQTFQGRDCPYTMGSDVYIGRRWCDEKKHPEGLRKVKC